MRADSSTDELEFELEFEDVDVDVEPQALPVPVPELFRRPASAASRKSAARSALGARSSVGPPRKSSRK